MELLSTDFDRVPGIPVDDVVRTAVSQQLARLSGLFLPVDVPAALDQILWGATLVVACLGGHVGDVNSPLVTLRKLICDDSVSG